MSDSLSSPKAKNIKGNKNDSNQKALTKHQVLEQTQKHIVKILQFTYKMKETPIVNNKEQNMNNVNAYLTILQETFRQLRTEQDLEF